MSSSLEMTGTGGYEKNFQGNDSLICACRAEFDSSRLWLRENEAGLIKILKNAGAVYCSINQNSFKRNELTFISKWNISQDGEINKTVLARAERLIRNFTEDCKNFTAFHYKSVLERSYGGDWASFMNNDDTLIMCEHTAIVKDWVNSCKHFSACGMFHGTRWFGLFEDINCPNFGIDGQDAKVCCVLRIPNWAIDGHSHWRWTGLQSMFKSMGVSFKVQAHHTITTTINECFWVENLPHPFQAMLKTTGGLFPCNQERDFFRYASGDYYLHAVSKVTKGVRHWVEHFDSEKISQVRDEYLMCQIMGQHVEHRDQVMCGHWFPGPTSAKCDAFTKKVPELLGELAEPMGIDKEGMTMEYYRTLYSQINDLKPDDTGVKIGQHSSDMYAFYRFKLQEGKTVDDMIKLHSAFDMFGAFEVCRFAALLQNTKNPKCFGAFMRVPAKAFTEWNLGWLNGWNNPMMTEVVDMISFESDFFQSVGSYWDPAKMGSNWAPLKEVMGKNMAAMEDLGAQLHKQKQELVRGLDFLGN